MMNGEEVIGQTRTASLVEVVMARAIVFVAALVTAELFVYEMFGVEVSSSQNFGIMVYWMFQNTVISYVVRRVFERQVKQRNAENVSIAIHE